ncbi:MAG: tRNA (N(6)-L-threonylcarbamoyladenosine(37)-C(2))-methylthiotransferase MtaB [Alphaproteobacteria bacterium]|nr:tRNA (N(6)-L-threonylcarbamoyladenosine(37)-C(2))-methylthiotransferase MtaB [Alphaproteobacteria bacterium]
MTAPRVITFGCRLNAYESELIAGLIGDSPCNDLVVVNTCAVTAEAERQARQTIRRAWRENPAARIVVTGCAAQIDPHAYAAMAEVDQVLGNEEKLRAESYLAADRVIVGDIMTVRDTAEHLVEGFHGRSRAFVQVQQGCDHRCTFCIIPFGRGNNRSVPVGRIVTEARTLVAAGYREIVLTGVDITGYGSDLPGRPSLGQMARRLLNLVPELERLRLSSLDPVEIDGDLFALIADEPRLMPHLHLSVQSGDDLILKRMKRRHLRRDVIDVCDRARRVRPDVVFGADIIAGFPTETEAMFERTLDLVVRCDLTYLHVFPYSARRGTPAARMPQVPMAIRRERAARLRRLGDETLGRFLDRRIGGTATVLVEKPDTGRSEHFAVVQFDRRAIPGTIRSVHISGAENGHLVGTLAA